MYKPLAEILLGILGNLLHTRFNRPIGGTAEYPSAYLPL
jgi:hypothetical protein